AMPAHDGAGTENDGAGPDCSWPAPCRPLAVLPMGENFCWSRADLDAPLLRAYLDQAAWTARWVSSFRSTGTGGAQDIEHRTMGVDHLFQLGEVGEGRGALQMNRAAHVVEAGAHTVLHREEAAQVERAFKLHRNTLEWNAERGRVGAVSDLLTSGQRGEHKLD